MNKILRVLDWLRRQSNQTGLQVRGQLQRVTLNAQKDICMRNFTFGNEISSAIVSYIFVIDKVGHIVTVSALNETI